MVKGFICTNILIDSIPVDREIKVTFSDCGKATEATLEKALENYLRRTFGAEDAIEVEFDWSESPKKFNGMVRPMSWFLDDDLEPQASYPFRAPRH